MKPSRPLKIFNRPRLQQGAALMVMLVIVVLGAAAILVNSLSSTGLRLERDKITADALAQAKEALIGRAVADDNRPGSLPCPDLLTNILGINIPNDGAADLLASINCPSYIGRFPWKTLGLPDLRDESGERLWYALSPNFRDHDSNTINSNSKGTMLVYDKNGTSLLTSPGSEAVAIIFAPGNIVAAQQRDTANQNLAQNYLDVGPNSRNNASGPFIAADKTNSYNDRLMIIRASDLIPIVEMRVAKELETAFAKYIARPANGSRYPYPAKFSCTSASCPSDSITPTCMGKIPIDAMAVDLPLWFTPNNWFDVIHYASLGGNSGGGGGGKKGKGKKGGGGTGGGGTGITNCTAPLTVFEANGNPINNVKALFMLPDVPIGNINRTSMSEASLSDYFEDAENRDLDNLHVMPSGISNDSLYILP